MPVFAFQSPVRISSAFSTPWIGGVPQHIRFDNLSAAVTPGGKGAERKLTETFTRFKLHYRFESEFCNKGKGNEKGDTENKVDYGWRNWMVPYLKLSSFGQITEGRTA